MNQDKMQKVILLDGGMGQEIFRRAKQPAHPMWSAKVMMDQPEIVKEVHLDFLKAGARIATINSYTCTPTRLKRDGKVEWFEKLQKLAIRIASEARDELEADAGTVQVAGCLPPLIGSYTTDERSFQTLKEEYQQIVEVQTPGVDLFIIETISNIQESMAAIEAALEAGKPVLLSYTLSDNTPHRLRSGETITDVLDAVSQYTLHGLLFNCSFPETISQGIEKIQHLQIPFGGYANGFTSVEALKPGGTVDALSAREDLDEKSYTHHVMDWINKGASIVGGCCEVGPTYIEHLHQELRRRGYTVTAL